MHESPKDGNIPDFNISKIDICPFRAYQRSFRLFHGNFSKDIHQRSRLLCFTLNDHTGQTGFKICPFLNWTQLYIKGLYFIFLVPRFFLFNRFPITSAKVRRLFLSAKYPNFPCMKCLSVCTTWRGWSYRQGDCYWQHLWGRQSRHKAGLQKTMENSVEQQNRLALLWRQRH